MSGHNNNKDQGADNHRHPINMAVDGTACSPLIAYISTDLDEQFNQTHAQGGEGTA